MDGWVYIKLLGRAASSCVHQDNTFLPKTKRKDNESKLWKQIKTNWIAGSLSVSRFNPQDSSRHIDKLQLPATGHLHSHS